MKKIFISVVMVMLSSLNPAATNLVLNSEFDDGDLNWSVESQWGGPYFYTDGSDTIASIGGWGNNSDWWNASIWQNTGQIFRPNTVYTMNVVWRDSEDKMDTIGIAIQDVTSDWTDVASAIVTIPGSQGAEWVTATLTFDTATDPSVVGNEIGVSFRQTSGTGAWVHVDSISLLADIDYVYFRDPANSETSVAVDLSDRDVSDNLSWIAPTDPNIAEIKGYDLYLDPNDVKVVARDGSCQIADSTAGGVTQYDPSSNFDHLTTYYWVVDTRYTRDDDPNVGTGAENIYVGTSPVYSFETTSAAPIIVDFNSVVVTDSMLPVTLVAHVSDSDGDLSGATFTLLTDDYNWPNPGSYTLTDTTTDLYAPSCTFTADTPGYYKIKLMVNDGTSVTEDRAEVAIYTSDDPNTCAAAQFNWQTWSGFNSMDFDQDCDVDLADFATFAAQWLDDRKLKEPSPYTWDIPYYVTGTILNGDFETGDLTGVSSGNWWSTSEVTITDVDPIAETYSAEWTVTDGNGGGLGTFVPVKANTNYTFSAKVSGGDAAGQFLVRYWDGYNLAEATYTPTTPPAVQTVNCAFTTGPDYEGVNLEFVIWSATDGIYYKVDDLTLVETP